MITKITLANVASYKSPTVLETNKKVNLIYGLNGAGKSVLSDYLYNFAGDVGKYKNCSMEGRDDDHKILVYNQTFIQENFFEVENQKGVFTLSKENKDAKTKIQAAEQEIKNIEKGKKAREAELQKIQEEINTKRDAARNTVWNVKSDYSGGDRVLEFCLEGYKGSKDSLFNHISSLKKPGAKPTESTEDLKTRAKSILSDNAQKYSELTPINFPSQDIERSSLFQKQIVGTQNSSVAQLIKKLDNSDWVKAGLEYLPKGPMQKNEPCPFCQQETISNALVDNIKKYFDASYEKDLSSLKENLQSYIKAIQSIPRKSDFEKNQKFEVCKKDFEIKYNSFIKIVEDNRKEIEKKIKTPSVSVKLENSRMALQELNKVIQEINTLVREHNKNIDEKESVRNSIKETFWSIMRWEYDQTINGFTLANSALENTVSKINTVIKDIDESIKKQKSIITEQQKQTVNIQEAVSNINSGLIDLGITDFKIKEHSVELYKIERGEDSEKIFRSLSEGEKMIISFLYFLELCKGKASATEAATKKIIVIDDPISSLSHIHVFNIGRLIHNEFLRNDVYEQIFLLTHSLYFFYEMTDINHDRREETQRLFRIMKNSGGSVISEMKYEEVQNDYQAYWSIIKDKDQPPALIANCMRNIVEYFFGFVEKRNLKAVFDKRELQENKFQAFERYINRESHSLGQNIFDFKEFDYSSFTEAFKTLFEQAGYRDHYNRMIK